MDLIELDQKMWGVCGFVAAIQAAVANTKGAQLEQDNYHTIYPIVNNFLMSHGDLESELMKFTKYLFYLPEKRPINKNSEPNPYIEDYEKNSTFGQLLKSMKNDKSMEQNLGVALSAAALKLLLEDLGFKDPNWFGTTAQTSDLKFSYHNAIYGVGGTEIMKTYSHPNFNFGLCHWIYVSQDGTAMTFGEKYPEEKLRSIGLSKMTHIFPNLT